MNKWFLVIFIFLPLNLYGFDGKAGDPGSHAIPKDSPHIISWASSVYKYVEGEFLDSAWTDQSRALGRAEGTSFDVVSLGSGGHIVLFFDTPIKDRKGYDFAVFENSFSDYFLELAAVFVSSNGKDFVAFKTTSLTKDMVSTYGTLKPEDINNFAGKYRQGYGTPFDLAELLDEPDVKSGLVDLNEISFIKIVDVRGDGSFKDSKGNPVYDPYPTKQSAGFDLDAVAVLDGVSFDDDSDSSDSGNSSSSDSTGSTGDSSGNGEDQKAGFKDNGCFLSIIFGNNL